MNQNKPLLLVVDYQERLMPVIHNRDVIVERALRMIEAFKIFDYPILVTEQYPKGLGHTIKPILDQCPVDVPVIEKTLFSAYSEAVSNSNTVVVIGVETHVCVYQTVKDLRAHGHEVIVCVDAVSSRFEIDRKYGLECMKALGAQLGTSEMIIYELMGDAKHPRFKDILKIVK